MRTLYLNNFRGFSETYISFEDVNFLVGENSTGKTSILSLLKVLSDPNFLFSLNFEMDDLDLGNFEDIVSYASEKRENFTVGFFETESKGNNKQKRKMLLVTYKNKKDTPVVDTYSYLSEFGLIHLKPAKNSIKYKVEKGFMRGKSENLNIEGLLKASIQEHEGDSKGYQRLPPKVESFKKAPLGIMVGVLSSYISGEKLEAKSQMFGALETYMENIVWIAPIREKPKRTYDQYRLVYSPEGTHTPYLLNDFLGDRGIKGQRKSLLKMLETFGVESELFKTIRVKRFGRNKSAPFEIDVILNEKPLKISNVGYGVSQVLPIVVECFLRKPGSTFAIQQPEVHLHPKAQASLGNFIFTLAKLQNKKFLIETHSDFLIDRFRQMQKLSSNVSAQVLFFERTDKGNKVYAISIDEKGRYGDEQPTNFRNFFLKEELEMLNL